ncbi:MAG: hypothetical protein AVDCRST_MAG19-2301, partial [uncultured Thermomicrobiales bacterium]
LTGGAGPNGGSATGATGRERRSVRREADPRVRRGPTARRLGPSLRLRRRLRSGLAHPAARRGSRRGPGPPAGGPLLLRRPAAGRPWVTARRAGRRHGTKRDCADPATRPCADAEQTAEDEQHIAVPVRSGAERHPRQRPGARVNRHSWSVVGGVLVLVEVQPLPRQPRPPSVLWVWWHDRGAPDLRRCGGPASAASTRSIRAGSASWPCAGPRCGRGARRRSAAEHGRWRQPTPSSASIAGPWLDAVCPGNAARRRGRRPRSESAGTLRGSRPPGRPRTGRGWPLPGPSPGPPHGGCAPARCRHEVCEKPEPRPPRSLAPPVWPPIAPP